MTDHRAPAAPHPSRDWTTPEIIAAATVSPYIVSRSTGPRHPDWMTVEDRSGAILLECPTRALAPRSAAEAKARPFFFTLSPFGAEILDIARERGLIVGQSRSAA